MISPSAPPQQQSRDSASLTLRRARGSDAPAIADIALSIELDVNSRYIYALWCRDFADFTAVAVDGSAVAGFIMCYPRPPAPDHLFIWQAGTRPEYRGLGLAGSLLKHVHAPRFTYVDCTVTPSNTSSLRFLQKFADDKGASLAVTPFLNEDVLGGTEHEREDLVSIGPIVG